MTKIYELEYEAKQARDRARWAQVPLRDMFEFGYNALNYNGAYIGCSSEEFEDFFIVDGLTLDTVVEVDYTELDCDEFTIANIKKVGE